MYYYTSVSHAPTIGARETSKCLYRFEVSTVLDLKGRMWAADLDIEGVSMDT